MEAIAKEVCLYFSSKEEAREDILRFCREITRCSSSAVRAVHGRKYIEAEKFLNSARVLIEKLNSDIPDRHNDLLYTGFVHDAQKEFAEANITLALVGSKPLQSPQTLGVSCAAFLNGLGEAVGELRRYLLDSLRKDDYSQCEEILSMMDDMMASLR